MVAVFPNVCLWRRSYSQNWEVLTFICQYGLRYCIVSPSFLVYCFVKIWATWENFLGKWLNAPLAKNCPFAYVYILFNYPPHPPLVTPPQRTLSPNLLLRRLKSEYRTAVPGFSNVG